MSVKVCSRCVMDNRSDNTITFDENGRCNYCNEALKRMSIEYYPNDEDKKKLDSIIQKIKLDSKDKEYDCIVGVSGGLDSSYVIYLGHLFGLRMLAVHIDDGLDTELAKENIKNLCDKANVKLITIKPDIEQYKDLIRSFFLARVPNLAMPQDNVLLAALNDIAKKYNIKYSLSGANFSLECILERSSSINSCDKKHIKYIHKRFGLKKINNIRLCSFYERYIYNKYFNNVKKILPLNYIDYNFENALKDLEKFSGYKYYGAKHHESILTRFLQGYYLPEKYNFDKRKSHLSSMIVSGQISREEALKKLDEPLYNNELKENDFNFLASYIGMSRQEFDDLLSQETRQHTDYKISKINNLANTARKFRKYLGE